MKAHIASPRNIFIINVILYCLFLVLFAFVIRIDSHNKSRDEHQCVSIETLFKFQVLPSALEMGTDFILLVPYTCFRRTPSGNNFQTFDIIQNSITCPQMNIDLFGALFTLSLSIFILNSQLRFQYQSKALPTHI